MTNVPSDITDTELSVLQALWDMQSASVREITERLYSKGTPSLIATVQKLLERLEGKKYVQRSRKTWPHQFSAAVERDVLIAQQLRTTADKLCQGEMHPLLTSLVKTRGLSHEDRKSLRGLLDELDRGSK
jgi:predicted transcriptional regulator